MGARPFSRMDLHRELMHDAAALLGEVQGRLAAVVCNPPPGSDASVIEFTSAIVGSIESGRGADVTDNFRERRRVSTRTVRVPADEWDEPALQATIEIDDTPDVQWTITKIHGVGGSYWLRLDLERGETMGKQRVGLELGAR